MIFHEPGSCISRSASPRLLPALLQKGSALSFDAVLECSCPAKHFKTEKNCQHLMFFMVFCILDPKALRLAGNGEEQSLP